MAKSSSSSTVGDAQALVQSLLSTYSATPTNLKIIDLYVIFSAFTALIQSITALFIMVVLPGGLHGHSWIISIQFFLSGVLSCVGTAVLAVCFRIQVNKENKEFKDLSQEHAFADFALCSFVLHLVINFLG